MCQSSGRRARTMLRLSLLVILLTHRIRTAHVTDTPFSNRFDKLYQKLEKLTVAPDRQQEQTPEEKLYEKLDRLNSLSPERVELTDEDEELLSAMRSWGDLSTEQMDGVVKDLQRMKEERRQDVGDQEYGEPAWDDEEFVDYPMDGNDDWDSDDLPESSSTSKPLILGVTPSAITRASPVKTVVVSALESIQATNARPRILEDPITPVERAALRRAAMSSMSDLLKNGKCVDPQPRWLIVRQLAPAADTRYLPPCVQLHRCAPDSGCCVNESEVCAPIEGKTVVLPFYLHKALGPMTVVRMQFFNHTRCGCVSRGTLQMTMTATAGKPSYSDSQEELDRPSRRALVESQNDWRTPTEEPILEKDEEPTASSQLRRCTCPALFLASMTDSEPCSCVCDWPDAGRRRDCQYLAKGREHFGLRDRVCVARGDCTLPSCEYGAYDRTVGKCPLRRYRRMRFHSRGRYQEKTMVV
ncbi:hypothetical protein PYW08_001927 [Mythimna loreyi]|uniref:Uncharacterized protein n=1 Tax=Mythimna loreyi TaxID=667449 RepID=A0ACC2R0U0_9NEOP|nr:hypothetical protein PYW08_001927 [Mythimna loreyi]